MSCGRVRAMSASSASMRPVSSIVPAPCCLVTVTSTAGMLLSEAVPRRGCAPPTVTSATSPTVTCPRSSARTTAAARASVDCVSISPLTIYSLP